MSVSLKKGKHPSSLKSIHSEQLSKLQQKHQQEVELLDDIRLFSKQRSILEKEYAQALIKLGDQFSKRKFPPPPDFTSEGQDVKTIWQVWQTVLDETRRVGEMRLQASETYMQQISEPAKPLKINKAAVAKKVFDQCSTVQKEVSQIVQTLCRSYKQYAEDEHVSNEARSKAADAEYKVKNQSTGIFTSIAKLQQASVKLNSRRDQCEVKSTAARNDYLLNMAVGNAQQARYCNTELPLLLKMLDGDMYEKTKEFFTTLARAELESCGLTQECFTKILTDACIISREFNLRCFLKENPLFTDCIQYQFEAQDKDQVTVLRKDHQALEQLQVAAQNWCITLVKNIKIATNSNQQITSLMVETKSETSDGKTDKTNAEVDTKLDEQRCILRKADTEVVKAKAALSLLEQAGISMNEFMQRAEEEAKKQEAEEMTTKQAPESNFTKVRNSHESQDGSTATTPPGQPSRTAPRPPSQSTTPSVSQLAAGSTTYVNYDDDDYVDETFGAPTAGGPDETNSMSTGYASMGPGRGSCQTCYVLYDFQANNSDEMSVWEGEQVEALGDVDKDGWIKARNGAGNEGLVPWNYLQLSAGFDPSEGNTDTNTQEAIGSSPAVSGHMTPIDSQDYPSLGSDTLSSRKSNYSATDYEVQSVVQRAIPEEGEWVRALCSYEATSSEELSFQMGQLIRVLHKDTKGVDDGFWEGEINGRIGHFPSLAVEELIASGNSGEGSTSPPVSLPPPPPLPVQDVCASEGYTSKDVKSASVYNQYKNNNRAESYV